MNESKMNWLIPAGIILIILVVSTLAFLNIRSSEKDEDTDNDKTTATATPTDTVTASVTSTTTPTGTTTTTVTTTPTSTTTPTGTTTATPTPTDSEITDPLNTNWVSALTTQTVGSAQYNISGKELQKNGTAVYTSQQGNIQSFYVNSSFIMIAEGMGSDGKSSRLIKYTPSTKKSSLIFLYQSTRLQINSFLFNTSDSKKYYLTMSPINSTIQPYIMYEKDYQSVWIKPLTTAAKGDKLFLKGVAEDNSKLYLMLQSGDASKVVEYKL